MISILNLLHDNSFWIQMLSMASGIVFMIMQVIQHKWVWYFGLVTSGAAFLVALANFNDTGTWAPLWAQVLLNAYFFIMDIYGIFSWKTISKRSGDDRIHIVRISRKAGLLYAAALIVAIPLLSWLLSHTNDPAPVAEGIAFAFSVVAQVMLTRSHIWQFGMWVAGNIVSIGIFISQGIWGMTALYCLYICNSVVGLIHWHRKGVYVD